jgi:DNA polymerase-3 subunit epsilon
VPFDDEIIQLAIVDFGGDILFETLLKPTNPISPEAHGVHGITDKDLDNAPTFSSFHDTIANLIRNRCLVAYNADFDRRLLVQTCDKYNLPIFEIERWDCVMEKYACFWNKRDTNNNFIRQSLTTACAQQGISTKGAHKASKDCLLTLELIKAMATTENINE